jgi:hypothetical protein
MYETCARLTVPREGARVCWQAQVQGVQRILCTLVQRENRRIGTWSDEREMSHMLFGPCQERRTSFAS